MCKILYDTKTINLCLLNFFKEITGISIMWENQKAKKFNYPYATLNILSDPKWSRMNDKYQTDDKLITIKHLSIVINIIVHDKENARNILVDASLKTDTMKARKILDKNQIVLINQDSILNIDQKLTNYWEKRVTQDYTFNYVNAVIEKQKDFFNKADIKGEII